MVDIHSHVIFGVDDGARDFHETTNMLIAAKQAGVTQIVATPHARVETFDRNKVIENYLISRKIAEEKGVSLRLGCEVHWNYSLMLSQDRFLDYCTKNTNKMLIEFSLSEEELPQNHDSMIYRLQRAGIEIIVAHPERYKFLQKDISCVYRWMDLGCKLQLDANCLIRGSEPGSKNTARKLFKLECYDYVASDAHCTDDYYLFEESIKWIKKNS